MDEVDIVLAICMFCLGFVAGVIALPWLMDWLF